MVPNVLIVVLDDVGVDQVSAYGFPGSARTPVIDALAADGLRFDAMWATPTCTPTRAALMTGRVAHRTGLGAVLTLQDTGELPLDEITLPEMLDRSGTDWTSAAIGKWHLAGPASPSGARHPLLQGFDWYSGSLNNIVRGSYVDWVRVGFDGTTGVETRFSTEAITDDAILAWHRLREPWLLYVAYHSAHRPLMPPPDDEGLEAADERALYRANVEDADRHLGRLLRAIGPDLDETLVIVLGDNGTPAHAQAPGVPIHGSKGTMFEGGLRVPFVVAGPPVTARGATPALAHVTDVFPTLMELAGVESVPRKLDGASLVPLFADPAARVHEVIYTETRHPPVPPWKRASRAARDEELKLVDRDGRRTVWRVDGFAEQRVLPADLTPEERERLARLRATLREHPRSARRFDEPVPE